MLAECKPELRERFETYRALLEKWQNVVNLVGRSTLHDFWQRHIEDSLQLLPYLRGPTVLDIGSGGGFPGMVIAMASDMRVTCLDSNSRKIEFLSEVARQTNTKVELVNDRLENYIKSYQEDAHQTFFSTVCARGFASLDVLVDATSHLSKPSYGVFLKGKNAADEIKLAQQRMQFNYRTITSVTNADSSIVIVEMQA